MRGPGGAQLASKRASPYGNPGRGKGQAGGGKVIIQGLDRRWQAGDVREILTEQGFIVKNVNMLWDATGRSSGQCEVTLRSVEDAKALVKDMDGAEVDGFPLSIRYTKGAEGGVVLGGKNGGKGGGKGNAQSSINVEGLDPNWQAKDIREIFCEQGYPVQQISILWDKSGRSQGKCKITLANAEIARTAQKDLDGAVVDGWPMKISLQGGQIARSLGAGSVVGRGRGGKGKGRAIGRGKGQGRGKGKGGGKGEPRESRTKEQLDAQLGGYGGNAKEEAMMVE